MNEWRLKVFNISMRAAVNFEAQQEFRRAAADYCYAVLSLVAIAVLDFSQPADGIEHIKTQGVVDILIKHESLARQLPTTEDLGIFETVGLAHVASLVNRHETAEYLVGRVQLPGRHFWNEYARAMQCLVTKQPYEPKLGKVSGSQKYWAAYLPFISDVTNGRDFSSSLAAMQESFQKRIKDKRITDDGGLILEGSGHHPTHWDFRTEGLKAYVTYKYGLTFPS